MRATNGRSALRSLGCAVVFASGAWVASGCTEKQEPQTAQLAPVQNLAPHPIVPLPDPEAQEGHVGKAPRRITVAQLAKSIEVTTGETWTQLESLAPSLGRADYALLNSENTEPTLVFAKFLEDGARDVCTKAARADVMRAPEERVLSREIPASITKLTEISADDAKKNLVYLSQRFWGVPLQGAELDSWLGLFQKAAERAETINKRDQAYAVVCIGLMTDPRFLSY